MILESVASNVFNACGRACYFPPPPLSLQLLDVSGESVRLWKGFLLDFSKIKATVFFKPLKHSPVTSTNHKAFQRVTYTSKYCLRAFLQ